MPTSMGKDSKLLEYLLEKANLKVPIDKIFNNTTLDCADVYKEVKQRPDIKIISPNYNNSKYNSFYKLVKISSTPSRMNRWCCDIFKEKSTEQYYNDTDKILFFYGMRNDESSKRANYKTAIHNDKLQHEHWIGCLPIRKWTELELWLYTIHNNIPINSKYKKGYSRCGCHCACPYYNKSTWILDKYWYNYQFNRWRKYLKKDFINGEKWTRMNCTLDEFYLNWNGGQVRNQPTDEVIEEFMQFKGLKDKNVAEQYFKKTCANTEAHKNLKKPKNVYHKNEVAMNLKMFGRNTNRFLCKKCLMKELNWTQEDWDNQVEKFKQQGCDLF